MDIEAELERARSVHRSGGVAEAVPVYERILQNEPDHSEALSLLGVAKLQTGCAQEAVSLLERAAVLAPDHAKIQNNLGTALLSLRRPADAAECFRMAAHLDPQLADAPYNLGSVLGATGKLDEAKRAYATALEIDPRHAAASNNLASILQTQGDMPGALELYRAAVRHAPQSREFRSNFVTSLEALNRIDEAEDEARELLRTAPDFPIARLIRARLDRRSGRLEAAREGLKAAIRSDADPIALCSLLYEMAHVLDQLGEYRDAFAACTRAKEVRRRMPDAAGWDMANYPGEVARYRTWFTADRIATIPGSPARETPGPVFFVGFPRSGTTLMEQILGAHPRFATTGEQTPLDKLFSGHRPEAGDSVVLPDGLAALTPHDIALLRRRFFEIADEVIGAGLGNRILLDKMPLNIVQLGAANWLFPDGKAIVALRDPRDTVLSCYMQDFQVNRAMRQFVSLEGAARLYAGVMDLWLHYREILTMPWLEYRYEDLVSDFEGTVAGVLHFLAVSWDDSVGHHAETASQAHIRTASYAAVTQPVYNRAVGRWRNYEAELAPVLPILEPFVREFGYDPS